MCGIAGLVFGDARRVDAEQLRRMSRTLQHRGPDDSGFLGWSPEAPARRTHDASEAAGGQVGLVHRRLSILDLSPLGWQPMSTPDGRYHLVYNGEVYNYVELRAELERAGDRFVSQGDTEVVLAALARWGVTAAVRRFEGMFAFALLDTRENTLTLARDAFGIKPLFFVAADGVLAFASEIRALLELELVRRTAAPSAVFNYLVHGASVNPTGTFFEHVQRVGPGETMRVRLDRTLTIDPPERYWELARTTEIDVGFDEAARMVREMFLENVAHHLRSDVPVGVALSGGIDSSAIAAAIRVLGPKVDLHAFSYLADDERLSEERWIRCAGAAAGATIHEVRASADGLAEDLDRIIDVQDEPFGSTSIYAQYQVFRAADRAGVKVMLDGQGADELLAGYGVFLAPHVSHLVRRARLVQASRTLSLAAAGSADVDPSYVRRYTIASVLPAWVKRLGRTRARHATIPGWIDGAWFLAREDGRGDLFHGDPGPTLFAHLQQSVRRDLTSLLRYEDRNSMAHSVESRVPFLTTRFAELLFSLPPSYLIDARGTRKAVFRQAMRGIVPDAVLDRRDKIGFQTPEYAWLGSLKPWVRSILGSDAAARLPVFAAGAVGRITDALDRGTMPSGIPLWRWVNFIRWAELRGVDLA